MHALSFAFELELSYVAQPKTSFEAIDRGWTREDPEVWLVAIPGLGPGDALQPGSDVHRITERGVFEASGAADAAGDHRTGEEADAHAHGREPAVLPESVQ